MSRSSFERTQVVAAVAEPTLTLVALVGNPNTGKTTLFNALTGFRRRTANYPGTTVDLARGTMSRAARPIEIVDLPGTYSLAALSPDELVVLDSLCGRAPGLRRPDVVVAIVDASNLPRNLYLVSQLLDLQLPLVVALNMMDVARSRGIEVDAETLAKAIGAPVVPIVAIDDSTLGALCREIESPHTVPQPAKMPAISKYTRNEVAGLRARHPSLCGAEALRVLLDPGGAAEQAFLARGGGAEELRDARARLACESDCDAAAEIRARYAWVQGALDGVIRRPSTARITGTERLDRVLTHPVGGVAALLVVLGVLFQAIFRWADPFMTLIDEQIFGRVGEFLRAALPEGPIQSLVVDGVVAGIGGVVVFLPQIMILFAAIALLEDCGYMARAAFMMDRAMRGLGLSGRAFIPLLSSFACAVPAIMGTRTIADRRERFVTIFLAPFMSCSARLPVYALLIGAFVERRAYLGGVVELPGLVLLAMYLVGVAVAIPIAWIIRKTVLAGPQPAFVLELPSYKLPRFRAVWQRVSEASRGFLLRAGTVILAVNLIVWALAYFPRDSATAARIAAAAAAQQWDEQRAADELEGAYLRESYLGKLGHAIEPAIRPLGWDWRIGMAVLASFPAREVVVGSLGTIFNLGSETDETSSGLRDALRDARREDGRPLFTLPIALSVMVFFALCAQCSSTLVVIGRETRSWTWPIASFLTMTALAYLAALAVVRIF
ncbi:MAG: ferrous iron transport protein B [Phycisphaerales bacterium]|nr:ferrous iron transport protein B [Phycisphaerales bacterium]